MNYSFDCVHLFGVACLGVVVDLNAKSKSVI